MSKKPFVHLHLHTAYSLLDGACHIDRLMDAVAAHDMPAVAITDHGVMYGCIDFYTAAMNRGIRPVLGCEVYIAPGSRFDKRSEGHKQPNNHLVLLAENNTGYANLVRLVSAAHLEGFYYKPRIDMELLREYHEGLICLTACLKGRVASSLSTNDLESAERHVHEYAEIFGKENLFIEVMDHGLPEERQANLLMSRLSERTGFPLVATNDVHYLTKEQAAAHEVLLCLQTQTVLSDPKHMRYRTDEFYLKTREEMQPLFREFPGALDRTLEIAERCAVEMNLGNELHFPTYACPDDKDQRSYLVELAHAGIRKHYDIPDPAHPRDEREQEVMDRFDSELAVIEQTGFVNYFLVVWDFIHYARQHNIPVGPGRGSGGGSLVAYALGITAIDPLRYSLIFERFLNPERVSPPDFDIDFCQARREEVIEYVKDKYGRDNCAQIITFGSLGAKMVIRDVGRVLEVPFNKCDIISKMVPEDPKMTLTKALELNPDFKHTYETDEDCKRILDYAFHLEGLYRNAGTHAAGVVIGEKPLVEIVPLALDKDKETVTQYTMEPLGELGLLKMDFLGLKTLTVIRECCDLVREIHDVDIDPEELTFDDPAAYALLNRGDTVGVFQLESAGMRDLIRRIGIDRIEDLIAMIALYRPGPMNMLPDYVDRKSGKAKVAYDHPLLEPILKETYGVMVYQEQVQKAANVLAGYSLGGADVLRRAMGKKKKAVMDEQRAMFIQGCRDTNNIDARKAGKIFDRMAQFAGYGFNKAHSAGYGIISYQTAFLKANYPAEFMAALISSEIGNFDKLPVFVNEAIAMDLDILPPDINTSRVRFRPEGERGVRFGLAGIKNVGAGVAEAMVKEREASGPFTDLVDLCTRVDSSVLNKKVLESLVRCGAMDSLGMHRARLFDGIDFAMSRAASNLRDRRTGQGSLFDLMDEDDTTAPPDELPDAPPWHESDLLAGERELLGIYMTGHPLTQYAGILERYQLTTVTTLGELEDRTPTRLGGIISTINKRFTKKKEPMAILELEDLDGTLEVLVFPEAYQRYGMVLQQDTALLVCGEVSRRDDTPKLIASELYPLGDAPRYFAQRLSISVPAVHLDADRIARLRDLLKTHPGTVPVFIRLEYPSGEKVVLDTDQSYHVLPDAELVHALEQELGEKSVYVAVNPAPCLRSDNSGKRRWRNGNGQG